MSKRYVVVDLETTGNSWKDGKDKLPKLYCCSRRWRDIGDFFVFVNPKERSHHLLQN